MSVAVDQEANPGPQPRGTSPRLERVVRVVLWNVLPAGMFGWRWAASRRGAQASISLGSAGLGIVAVMVASTPEAVMALEMSRDAVVLCGAASGYLGASLLAGATARVAQQLPPSPKRDNLQALAWALLGLSTIFGWSLASIASGS